MRDHLAGSIACGMLLSAAGVLASAPAPAAAQAAGSDQGGQVQAAQAQALQARAMIEAWGFDPSALVADGRELLLRAPDSAIDGLFQALLDSARRPGEARALCMLFDPRADRSLAGLNAAAAQFDPATRERYVNAVAHLFVAATRHPPQPFDPAAARQALTQAGVRAALLNDGFGAGLGGDSDARCRSLAMLLDALAPRPLPERAAVTRLLLIDGLGHLTGDNLADGRPPL